MEFWMLHKLSHLLLLLSKTYPLDQHLKGLQKSVIKTPWNWDKERKMDQPNWELQMENPLTWRGKTQPVKGKWK